MVTFWRYFYDYSWHLLICAIEILPNSSCLHVEHRGLTYWTEHERSPNACPSKKNHGIFRNSLWNTILQSSQGSWTHCPQYSTLSCHMYECIQESPVRHPVLNDPNENISKAWRRTDHKGAHILVSHEPPWQRQKMLRFINYR